MQPILNSLNGRVAPTLLTDVEERRNVPLFAAHHGSRLSCFKTGNANKSGTLSPLHFLSVETGRVALLRNPLFFVGFRWTQPQRDMCWLHGLLHDGQQPFAQRIQLYLLAQG